MCFFECHTSQPVELQSIDLPTRDKENCSKSDNAVARNPEAAQNRVLWIQSIQKMQFRVAQGILATAFIWLRWSFLYLTCTCRCHVIQLAIFNDHDIRFCRCHQFQSVKCSNELWICEAQNPNMQLSQAITRIIWKMLALCCQENYSSMPVMEAFERLVTCLTNRSNASESDCLGRISRNNDGVFSISPACVSALWFN